MQNQKDFYEKAGTYMKKDIKINTNRWPNSTHEAAIRFAEIKKRDKLLEVGCGRGLHFKYYLKKTENLYGLDISKSILKEVYMKEKVKLSEGNIEEGTKFKDNYFDVIVLVDVIEHTINRYKVFRELNRILKKGGKIVIITPNLVKAKNRFRFFLGKYPHTASKKVRKDVNLYDGGHLQYFTFKTLRDLAEREGFKVEKEYGFGRFGRLHNFFREFTSGSICMILKKN